jgi:hypothetical protein
VNQTLESGNVLVPKPCAAAKAKGKRQKATRKSKRQKAKGKGQKWGSEGCAILFEKEKVPTFCRQLRLFEVCLLPFT